MYILSTNNQVVAYPYSFYRLMQDNPQISFPKNPSDDLLASYNVFSVQPTDQPMYDHATHSVDEGAPVNINGTWTQVWTVEQLPQDVAAANVRAHRAGLLSDCDWTQVADAPVDKTLWSTYRQALRDISKQPGFPWSVEWPVQPA